MTDIQVVHRRKKQTISGIIWSFALFILELGTLLTAVTRFNEWTNIFEASIWFNYYIVCLNLLSFRYAFLIESICTVHSLQSLTVSQNCQSSFFKGLRAAVRHSHTGKYHSARPTESLISIRARQKSVYVLSCNLNGDNNKNKDKSSRFGHDALSSS